MPAKKPNILWFVVDDMSANFSSYGEKAIQTPHVDRLAREGTRFANAFVTAPVCSPCRSALITGMYQTSIGAHHHRSDRGELKIHLPPGVVPVPKLFQQAGYYTCIGSGLPVGTGSAGKKGKRNGPGLGKTDYNFEWDASIYDSADWSGREARQPFFMQVQLGGGKLRGGTDENAKQLLERAKLEFGHSTDPDTVKLPPYYPRDPVLLRDWAAYLDAVRFTDKHVGDVVARLEKEGILDNMLIIFMTDHGISHARGKQFLYNEGTHIPFVVRGPGIKSGQVREDLIEHIDMAAISLAAAGLSVPDSMQGGLNGATCVPSRIPNPPNGLRPSRIAKPTKHATPRISRLDPESPTAPVGRSHRSDRTLQRCGELPKILTLFVEAEVSRLDVELLVGPAAVTSSSRSRATCHRRGPTLRHKVAVSCR